MKTIRIMIVAVGGQGNILAARVLGDAAVAAGIDVRMSEFHGMAQRGGVVESMVLLGEGKGYCIADGTADVLLGFEPSETLRAAKKCTGNTVVISNTSPQPPFTAAMGLAQYPDLPVSLRLLADRVQSLIAFDATALAVQAGSQLAMNMVLLGALAGSGTIPLKPEIFLREITEQTKKSFVEVNLKAFQLGIDAVNRETCE